MKTVTMLQLRQNALAVIRGAQRGQRFILTYRGRPMARIEPLAPAVSPSDPIYRLAELADDTAGTLTNRDIDDALYGA